MSVNSKSPAEDIINKCENKPNQEEWMKVKKCFQDLQEEVDYLTKSYPDEAKKRKVPDTSTTKSVAMMTENVNTVVRYLENAKKYNQSTAGSKDAAMREVSDMAYFVYELKEKGKELGKGDNVSRIQVNSGGASSQGPGEQSKDIDKTVSESKKPKQLFDSEKDQNQKGQHTAKKFSQTLPISLNVASAENQTKTGKQKQGTTSTRGAKEKEEDIKSKKNANENKNDDELQKKIRELEAKVKKMETDEKQLIEKANLAENRSIGLENENEKLKSDYTGLQSSNEEIKKQYQQLQHNQTVLDNQCRDLRSRLGNAEALNAEVESENKYLKEQVDELTMRLSSFASKQLSEGNPNVADLSDQNRPTKIGEKFGSLYDDEWSEAFDAITSPEKSEEDAIKYLIYIIQESYKFCSKTANEQLEKLNEKMKTLMTKFEYKDNQGQKHEINSSLDNKPIIDSARAKYAKDYRKAAASESLLGVTLMFKEKVLKEELDKLSGEAKVKVMAYVDKCTEVIWYMVVQDPPMVFEIPEPGKPFNVTAFKPYTKKGKHVKLVVWPAVKLFENGGLISKGYALPE